MGQLLFIYNNTKIYPSDIKGTKTKIFQNNKNAEMPIPKIPPNKRELVVDVRFLFEPSKLL